MVISEVLIAAGELAAETAEVATAVEETVKGAAELSEAVESLNNVLELTEKQVDYLSELNVPNEAWNALSPKEQGLHLDLINSRIKEMGVKLSPESLEGVFDSGIKEAFEAKHAEGLETIKEGLTPEEKIELKKETGWSDRIVDYIGSMEEAKVYKDAGLVESEVNGRAALIQPKLEWDTPVGPNGETNVQLLVRGTNDVATGNVDKWYSPRWNDGTQMELHHIGQHPDSPFAELTWQQHHAYGNDAILHDKLKVSEIDRAAFYKERSQHWISRFLEHNK